MLQIGKTLLMVVKTIITEKKNITNPVHFVSISLISARLQRKY